MKTEWLCVNWIALARTRISSGNNIIVQQGVPLTSAFSFCLLIFRLGCCYALKECGFVDPDVFLGGIYRNERARTFDTLITTNAIVGLNFKDKNGGRFTPPISGIAYHHNGNTHLQHRQDSLSVDSEKY